MKPIQVSCGVSDSVDSTNRDDKDTFKFFKLAFLLTVDDVFFTYNLTNLSEKL